MNGRARFTIRARLVGALLVAAAVTVGGIALEQRLGPRELTAGELPDEISGAWFCPHGGGGRWKVWTVVANPSAEVARVRVTTYGPEDPSAQELEVEPGSQRYVEVTADEPAAASTVEYFGARVAAGMVMARTTPDGDPRGRAAESCLAEGATRWYLPEGTTDRGLDVRVVVMNPFPQEAVVSLWLTDERETVKPGRLTGLIVPERGVRAVDLGEVALGKTTLATTVDVGLGKVAVSAVGISEDGLRASVGVAERSTSWVLPGVGGEGSSAIAVHAPGRALVPFRVRRQGPEQQIEVVGEGEVEPGKAATVPVDGLNGGFLLAGESEEELVAGRRLRGRNDLASATGVQAAAGAWVALPATPPGGDGAVLFLQNPGDEVAEVELSLLTETGPAQAPELAEIAMRPGSTRTVDLADFLGAEPVSVMVTARTGAVVAGQAAEAPEGYAVAVGVPLEPTG